MLSQPPRERVPYFEALRSKEKAKTSSDRYSPLARCFHAFTRSIEWCRSSSGLLSCQRRVISYTPSHGIVSVRSEVLQRCRVRLRPRDQFSNSKTPPLVNCTQRDTRSSVSVNRQVVLISYQTRYPSPDKLNTQPLLRESVRPSQQPAKYTLPWSGLISYKLSNVNCSVMRGEYYTSQLGTYLTSYDYAS